MVEPITPEMLEQMRAQHGPGCVDELSSCAFPPDDCEWEAVLAALEAAATWADNYREWAFLMAKQDGMPENVATSFYLAEQDLYAHFASGKVLQ